jgi:hypothetical protein
MLSGRGGLLKASIAAPAGGVSSRFSAPGGIAGSAYTDAEVLMRCVTRREDMFCRTTGAISPPWRRLNLET